MYYFLRFARRIRWQINLGRLSKQYLLGWLLSKALYQLIYHLWQSFIRWHVQEDLQSYVESGSRYRGCLWRHSHWFVPEEWNGRGGRARETAPLATSYIQGWHTSLMSNADMECITTALLDGIRVVKGNGIVME